ncbi:hypothetical protein BZG36_00703 [Bifiguratus adelaidae]|uniref:Protein BTN n=1 Tax=Bifiguratus adelaidae TaxID=1938954 RepID=A0A261Y759_9FUNG|nr:hypothetical protein BZG36_00703 [Bifiguratus adelaidae]
MPPPYQLLGQAAKPLRRHGDILAFFTFALHTTSLNNVIYVIILSAAVDLVGRLPKGIVLLADILPSLLTKLIVPYFILRVPYWCRVSICAGASILALQIIAWSESLSVRIFGIVIASFSSGFGEITFLMLTSFYDPVMVAAWSSGTGAAGVLGAVTFLVMTTGFGLDLRQSLILVSLLPTLMLVMYFFVLQPPSLPDIEANDEVVDAVEPLGDATIPELHTADPEDDAEELDLESDAFSSDEWEALKTPKDMTMKENLRHVVRPLIMPFILPMFVVYWAEYTINQGVAPTLLFPVSKTPFANVRDHYVTYQALYQVGVFVSRSSVTFYPIHRVWIPALSQVVILFFFILQALFSFLPSIWIVFIVIFVEGLFGGAVYVNVFHRIRCEVPDVYKELSMGVVGMADGSGITLAGLISVVLEPLLCCAAPDSVCCLAYNDDILL